MLLKQIIENPNISEEQIKDAYEKMTNILKLYKLQKLFGSLFDGAKASGFKIYARLI